MHNLTEPVTVVVHRSGFAPGLLHVHNVDGTGAVGAVEFGPGLRQGLPAVIDEIIPPDRTCSYDYAREQ